VVEISPKWVTGPEQGKSSGRVATFSLWKFTNLHIAKELEITPVLDKLLGYKRN